MIVSRSFDKSKVYNIYYPNYPYNFSAIYIKSAVSVSLGFKIYFI